MGLAAVGALGVSMLIIWLLVQYLSYGNRREEVAEGTRKENVETQDLDKIGIKGKNGLEKADANHKTLLVSTPEAFFLFWVQKVCT